MDSAAKRQKIGGGYDWKLTPIPKADSGKLKGAGKGPAKAAIAVLPAKTKSAVSTNLKPAVAPAVAPLQQPSVGLKRAPLHHAKSALDRGLGKGAATSKVDTAVTAPAKFAPSTKAGAPIGKSVSPGVPKSSAATFSAPKSAPVPAVKGPVTNSGVGILKGQHQPAVAGQGKAAGIVPTSAKAKAKAPETIGKGTVTSVLAAQGKGKGKGLGGKPLQGGKTGIPNRACRCGNNVAEEYWQALESKETYCSKCWEKIQARSPTQAPTFGMLLGLEAMRDLGVQLPIAV